MLRLLGRTLAAGLFLFAGASHAQVVVSQIYGGGGNSGAPFRSDFIELHNNGVSAVDLSTWSVQYASSTGTTWARTNLTGSIAAGGYYLVKQADGAGTTLPVLPTPDATGTIAMSGTAGKVALVNNQTTLTGACPLGATVPDFVGFGTANCSETSPTAAPSNTTAVIRAGNGCTDSGNNSTDFATGAPTPRNTGSSVSVCGVVGLPLLAVNDVSAFEGDTGTTTMTFGFGLSAPAGVGGVSITYTTADGTATAGSDYVANSGTATIAEGATSTTVAITVNGDTTAEASETYFVRISAATGATISDNEGLGTIQNDDVSVVAIPQIQGSGLTSPLNGAIVTTEGIVTAQKFNNGFFLQAANDDGNPATSEGIFVFTSTAPPATATVGNRIRVTGTVVEFTPSTNLNQLSITEITTVTSIQVLSTGNALPAPVELTSTDFGAASTPGTGEKFEGMRISVARAIAVAGADGNITESSATSSTTGVFHIVLSSVDRPFREPGIGILDTFPIPGGKTPPRFDTNQERLMVRSRGQIGAVAIALDAGAEVNNLVGVLDYFSGAWAVLPDAATPPTIVGGKTPTPVASASYEAITVGGFNLLRFFDEVNDSNGAPTLTAAAVDKRLTKTGLAICDFMKAPDILGVVEVENLRVLGLLADRINSTCASAPAYVPYLVQGNDVGGINVGFLVSNRSLGTVSRVEVLEVAQFGKGTLFNNPNASTSLLNDRPPLMLRAILHQDNGATYPLTVFVNHLRSLNGIDDTAAGSSGWPTESERVRTKRAQQAVFLANLIQARQQANPSENIVLLGDFNAFEFSDGYADVMGIVRGDQTAQPNVLTWIASPITTPLIDGSQLIVEPAERYSYVFDGNAQTLDHVVVNESMVLAAADLVVDHARINADFGVHNYGVAGNAIRVSDHDPVRLAISVADFRTADLSITAAATPANVAAGGIATFTANVSNAGPNKASFPSVALVFDALVSVSVTAPAGWTCTAPVQVNNTTTIPCTAASLDATGTAAFSAAVIAPSLQTASTLRLAAAVSSQTRDRVSTDNSASAQVAVAAVPLPSADLSLRMVGGPSGFIRAGSTALFSVPVRNTGPNAVPQAVVTFSGDIPLANANVIAPPGWICVRSTTPTGFSIVCTLGVSFGINERRTFTFSGVAPSQLVQSSMNLSSRVSSTTTTDPVPSNDASVYSVNIVAP